MKRLLSMRPRSWLLCGALTGVWFLSGCGDSSGIGEPPPGDAQPSVDGTSTDTSWPTSGSSGGAVSGAVQGDALTPGPRGDATSGTSGTSGTAGATGSTGATSGTSGAAGASGVTSGSISGATGGSGTSGISGASGSSGATGSASSGVSGHEDSGRPDGAADTAVVEDQGLGLRDVMSPDGADGAQVLDTTSTSDTALEAGRDVGVAQDTSDEGVDTGVPQICVPGERYCDGARYSLTCNATGTRPVLSTDCYAAGSHCVQGMCQDALLSERFEKVLGQNWYGSVLTRRIYHDWSWSEYTGGSISNTDFFSTNDSPDSPGDELWLQSLGTLSHTLSSVTPSYIAFNMMCMQPCEARFSDAEGHVLMRISSMGKTLHLSGYPMESIPYNTALWSRFEITNIDWNVGTFSIKIEHLGTSGETIQRSGVRFRQLGKPLSLVAFEKDSESSVALDEVLIY